MTKEYMEQYLSDPEKRAKHNARQRTYESKPEVIERRKAYRKARQSGGYFVYYLPSENYCGITVDMYARESQHRTIGKKDTTGMRVLFHSLDRSIAAHHEAMFQSVLGMYGLNAQDLNN